MTRAMLRITRSGKLRARVLAASIRGICGRVRVLIEMIKAKLREASLAINLFGGYLHDNRKSLLGNGEENGKYHSTCQLDGESSRAKKIPALAIQTPRD